MIELTMWELLFWGFLQAFAVSLVVANTLPGLKVTGPVVLWKSRRGLKKINAIAKKHHRLWEIYGDFGIILAFGIVGALYVFRRSRRKWLYSLAASLFLMSPSISNAVIYLVTGEQYLTTNTLFAGDLVSQLALQALLLFFGYSVSLVYLIMQSAFDIVLGYLTGTAVQAAVAPALPGIAIKGSPFQIPWYGWLAFPILIFVHELSHGILVKATGLRLKATGLLMFGVFPLGAFVEPDEKQLKKAPAQKRLRIYSVGSTANYLTSFAVLAFFILAMVPALDAAGYYDRFESYYDHPTIGGVLETSDGYGRLADGMKIISINGTNVPSIAVLHNITSGAGPGSLLSIATDQGTFGVRLSNESMIGITGLQDTFHPMPLEMDVVTWLIRFTALVVFFNFIVGVMNLLPMYPLDGGLMLEALTSTKIGKKKARRIAKAATVLVLALIFINMLPLFFP
ncbi:MAG: site-2 protease family protein [Candidatus Diapherotrites archaeon]|nr:site-2 protease family protein [Candidatus Diapherotrites archaeon]